MKQSGRITSMVPFEAFWHERFGVVVVFKVTTEPDVRDYAFYKHPCDEKDARGYCETFIDGFNGGAARAKQQGDV